MKTEEIRTGMLVLCPNDGRPGGVTGHGDGVANVFSPGVGKRAYPIADLIDPAKLRKVRTKADIEDDPRVEELWSEDNGWGAGSSCDWWCSLKPGWSWCPETHCIHEGTVREVCGVLNREVEACEASCPCQKKATVAGLGG